MVINDVEIDMDERVWKQLLALPYSIALDDEGHLVMTPLQEPALTWEELATTHPILPENLGWKVETNARNQMIMSPPPGPDHQDYGHEILSFLDHLMPEGRSFYETGVKTKDGTRIPDVGWMSRERRRVQRQSKRPSFFVAPEICVEIISRSNTRREINEKKRLYFAAGVQEVWRCELDGRMNFFDANGPLPKSRLCPDFPAHLELPD